MKRPDKPDSEGAENNEVSNSSRKEPTTPTEDKVDVLALYKQLGQFIKKGESVLKAVKRLGALNKPLSASERLKQKKLQAKLAEKEEGQGASSSTPKSADVPSTDVVKVTEIANAILQATGNLDIYEETYESISIKVRIVLGFCECLHIF